MCNGFIYLESIQKKEYYITMNQIVDTEGVEVSLKEDYLKAAELFAKSDKYRDAGLCYFNGLNYVKARQYFEKSEMKKEAALMNYLLGHYTRASNLFYEIEDYYSCLICKEIKGNISDFLEIMMKMFEEKKELKKDPKYIELFDRYAKRYFEGLNEQMYLEIAEQEFEETKETEEKSEKEDMDKKIEPEDEIDKISGMDSFVNIGNSVVNTNNESTSFADAGSQMSNFQSFKMLQEFSQTKDNLSESFVNITYDNKGEAMSQGDLSFPRHRLQTRRSKSVHRRKNPLKNPKIRFMLHVPNAGIHQILLLRRRSPQSRQQADQGI